MPEIRIDAAAWKHTVALLALICLCSTLLLGVMGTRAGASLSEKRTFKRIVLVSYDGARKHWIDLLLENGTLPHLASLEFGGTEISIRIIDHDPKTDPGMACIESGYGPDITGIDRNYFDATEKPSIPNGLTTTERIKERYGDAWKTALVMPWSQGAMNVTASQDSTFWNQREETDYWFSSENLTWSWDDPAISRNALDFSSALLRANYTALKLAEFIRQNKDHSFYARVHFVEPDYAGHAYGESIDGEISPRYREALIECDEALGLILEALKETGVYQDTVVLATTDHGFSGSGHGPPVYPFGDPDVTVVHLISSDPEVSNELGWGIQNDISPTILALAGIDPASFKPYYNETSQAMPVWMANLKNREVTPPTISNIDYTEQVFEGETFNVTVTAQDESGIMNAQIRYRYNTIWRQQDLTQKGSNIYMGSLGPFTAGIKVYWYVRVVDKSTSRNIVYYPANGTPLTFTVQKAGVTPPTPVIHDVRIVGVISSLIEVIVGDPVSITVVAANNGTEAETFNVTAYYDATAIGTQKIINLTPGAYETLTFIWDTPNVNPGEYSIKAVASVVTGETNTDDNTYVGNKIRVKRAPAQPPAQLPTSYTLLYIATGIAIITAAAIVCFVRIRKMKRMQRPKGRLSNLSSLDCLCT